LDCLFYYEVYFVLERKKWFFVLQLIIQVFTVNVIQKDKENENIPFSNCFLQVVDLAGSERIAKSLTEGHKY